MVTSASTFDGAEAAIKQADALALEALRIQHFGSQDDRRTYLFSQGWTYGSRSRKWDHPSFGQYHDEDEAFKRTVGKLLRTRASTLSVPVLSKQALANLSAKARFEAIRDSEMAWLRG